MCVSGLQQTSGNAELSVVLLVKIMLLLVVMLLISVQITRLQVQALVCCRLSISVLSGGVVAIRGQWLQVACQMARVNILPHHITVSMLIAMSNILWQSTVHTTQSTPGRCMAWPCKVLPLITPAGYHFLPSTWGQPRNRL